MRLIAVVLGTTSDNARAQESQTLLAYGFRFFRNFPMYAAGQELNRPQVWKGEVDTVGIGLTSDLSMTIPRGSEDKLAANLDLPPVLEGPIEAGQVLGYLSVSLDGKELRREPLVALSAVPEAGLLKSIWHSIVLFFNSMFG
jgi:D-alanyl-D-alanine carboxypeptidase (penicillin-binding protein 5/6)